MVISMFLLLTLGSLFGRLMTDSKATVSVAYKLMDIFGKKNALFVLLLVTTTLCYAGINAFVVIFSIYPVAVVLCKEAKIPKRLALSAILSGAAIISMALPGNAQNVQAMLADAFEVSIFGGAVWGVLYGVAVFIVTWIYLVTEHKRALARGEDFVEGVSAFGKIEPSRDGLPNIGKSLLPLVGLIIAIFITSKSLGGIGSVTFGLLIGIFLTYILFWKHFQTNRLKQLNEGLSSGFAPLINAAAVTGYAVAIQALPVFQDIIQAIFAKNMDPVVVTFLLPALIGGVTASSPAAGGFCVQIAPQLLGLGIDPGIALRFALIGSIVTVTMPHSGAIIAGNSLTGTTHKESYKDIFITAVVIPTIIAILMIVCYLFFA